MPIRRSRTPHHDADARRYDGSTRWIWTALVPGGPTMKTIAALIAAVLFFLAQT
jgi:hypothetical protein